MKRPVRIGYLVIGLIFIGLSTNWLLHESGVIEDDGGHWFIPATLLIAGLVGLVGSLGKGIAGRRGVPTAPPSPEPTPQPTFEPTAYTVPFADHETTTEDQS